MRHLAVAVLLAVVASACATSRVSYRQMNQPPRKLEPRPPESVEMMSLAPQRPYLEVALIEALHTSYRTDDSFGALRKLAGEVGCDGVVLRAGSDQWDTWRGTCIIWTDKDDEEATGQPTSPSAPANATILSAAITDALKSQLSTATIPATH